MKKDQIKVTEQENKDGSATYEIRMPEKQFESVSKVLSKEGYTIASYLKTFLLNLVNEDANGPVHQWIDQQIVDCGDEIKLKKEVIEKAKERIKKKSK